ncbi:hypothetical protein DEJ48_27285 [Streptomyces venezuelae]|uniref:Uncharacterized protein n=1 Tax=Streptomyces venezuelae TaxID=54571 RepID=A0A5P2C5M1_STRVZ|nr:hypothetical protein [Streptomyces venezuelae]QES36611.1 hypothetical protein DEJ48_27285 [Streptomyces venezuelae]
MTDTPADPAEPLPLPCSPCLRRLVTDTPEPHDCDQMTRVSIARGGELVVGAEQNCPCICPRQMESAALKTVRAQARSSARTD